jgi:hypothetical protein
MNEPLSMDAHDVDDNDVVESADDLAILSTIKIIWCSGKNCWVVRTRHIIVDCQQQQRDYSMLWRALRFD